MTPIQEDSVEQLRRQSELTRSELTHTVRELREKVSDTATDLRTRISPKHIKEEVKDYVRESGEQLFKRVERKARENPLQAIAIGAGLAYPLWGLLRRVPLPLMLMGAGVLFAKQNSGHIGQAESKARELAANATAQVSDLASAAQDALTDGSTKVADAVSTAGAGLLSGVSSIAAKVSSGASEAKSSVAGMGQEVIDKLQNAAVTVTDTLSQTALAAKDGAVDVSEKSRSALIDIADRNPLLTAGVGLAIGAFIAASLPRSDTENRLFGESSDDLRNKALGAASQGVDRAKEMASSVVSEVASAASREGLSTDGLKKTVEGLTASVKSVADRGMQAARGEETFSPPTSTHPYKN